MATRMKSNKGIPQLTTQEKLEQIRSGKVLQRRKSALDIKGITVVSGKDGSKITKKETAEKFEETAVRKKKKNYVMYESKLGTEKSTEIKKIEAPKPKKSRPIRTPAPRVEERIIITKKRKEYLDNYQYHESRVLKRKNPSVVEHRRLGEIYYGESEYNTMTITTTSSANRRIAKNRSEMTNLKQPAATATNFYTRIPNLITNTSSPQKSQIVTNQIMSRRNAPQTTQTRIEVRRTVGNTESKSHPRTPAPERSSSRGDSRNKMNERYSTNTMITSSSVKRRNNNNPITTSITKTVTKVERRGLDNQTIDTGKTSTNVSMRKRYKQK
jgi:hypothetical protein